MSRVLIINRQRRYRLSINRLRQFGEILSSYYQKDLGTFSVLLTTDKTLRRYNLLYRCLDEPTDILSFTAQFNEVPNLDCNYLGDMMISVEFANKQALAQNHSLEKEIKILMIHGWLHLKGWDHEVDQGQMCRREMKLQRELL